MKENKSTHGGRRPNQTGRPPKPPDERRTRYTFRITPKNLSYLNSKPAGERSEFINLLIESAQKK